MIFSSIKFKKNILILFFLVSLDSLLPVDAHVKISNIMFTSIEERITTLERIADAQGKLVQQLQQQLFANQNEIDQLRGQIQENNYHINQIIERERDIGKQITSMTSHLNKLTIPNNPLKIIDDKREYTSAVALILEKKEYDQAIVAFQKFLKKYPNSSYQANAHYWLGQLHYNTGKKDDAAYYFATIAKNYPKSAKRAEALLKIGIIMQEKGEKNDAESVYNQVINLYPNSDAAKQAKKRLVNL